MLTPIKAREIQEDVFSLIGKRWMLVSAGREHDFNTMTASWGGLGVLFHKKVATIYIRPQRYTLEFLEREETFTLSFFGEECRDTLKLLGTKSGRDGDKIAESGLTPLFLNETSPTFSEAELVLVCRKLYQQDFQPEGFLDAKIEQETYPNQDYHRMYIAEIVEILAKA